MNISIIIPVYNVEPYIERCLNSIMNQTFTDGVECIIVNDCSPDKSLEIAQHLINQYKGNILFRIISHDKNQGVAVARNTGLKAAQGEYIIQIDSDDYCELDMLEDMYKNACENDSDIVIADYFSQYKNHATYISQPVLPHNKTDLIKEFLCGNIKPFLWNKLIRNELYRKNNITFKNNINYGEDYLIELYLFYYAKKISHICKAYVHYVQYNVNSYSKIVNRKSLEDMVLYEQNIMKFFTEKKLYAEYKKEISFVRTNIFFYLIYRSSGNLQKRWLSYYKDLSVKDIIHSNKWWGIYWKMAAIFALYNMLPVYNLMRNFWRLLNSNKAKSIPLYSK